MIDKSKYSFLIAFVRQLASALDHDDDDDIAIILASLGTSLDVLRADYGDDPGVDDGGLPEGVDNDDAPGADTPLGAALARIAELERGAPPPMDVARKVVSGGTPTADSGMAVGRKRRGTAVLTASSRGRGGKRRGKK